MLLRKKITYFRLVNDFLFKYWTAVLLNLCQNYLHKSTLDFVKSQILHPSGWESEWVKQKNLHFKQTFKIPIFNKLPQVILKETNFKKHLRWYNMYANIYRICFTMNFIVEIYCKIGLSFHQNITNVVEATYNEVSTLDPWRWQMKYHHKHLWNVYNICTK